jgi:hypothetical protein
MQLQLLLCLPTSPLTQVCSLRQALLTLVCCLRLNLLLKLLRPLLSALLEQLYFAHPARWLLLLEAWTAWSHHLSA